MVSVALLTLERGGPIPREEWTIKEKQMARRFAKAAIDGVGEVSTDIVEEASISYIIRRQCRDDERRQVVENFLSTP